MTKLCISPNLALPADVVTSTSVVFGGKGMGKTNLGSVLVEELSKAGLRWCFLDPMGVAFGLRHSKDGKGPGVECVILGGIHGDIPILPDKGEIVADLVVDEPVSAIIDFSRNAAGVPWSKGEKIKFVTSYVNRLFRRQGEMIGKQRREPILQILDEAARYIPQLIPHGSPELAACVGAWEQVAEEGRNIGLGVCFLTQRSARINKSVSELADVMFAFRTVGPHSVDAIIDWLGEHMEKARARELAGQIRELDVGQCLVVSPGWLKVSDRVVQIRPRETFDSSATPKPGERPKGVTGEAAKPDLARYQARMAETIEKAKADDPKELRKEIAALKAENRKLAGGKVADPAAVQARVEAAIDEARAKWTRELQRIAGQQMKNLHAAIGKIGAAVSRLAADASGLTEAENALLVMLDPGYVSAARAASSTSAPERRPAAPPPARTIAPRRAPSGPSDSSLSKGERTLLIAIAQYPDGAEREQLTVLTGYKRSSRDTYIQRLGAKGYIETTGGAVLATDAGVDALGSDYEPLPTGEALQAYWLDRLGGGEKKILEVLIEAGGDPVSRETISERTEYLRSSRDTYLQRLTSRRLVESVGRGEVRASTMLFE